MDTDVSRWVMEFLLRSSAPDSLISKALTVLPLSGADSCLKKTLLLRVLQSQHSKAAITETTLEILEILEQIDLTNAVPVSDAMRHAYCAVAVECTVKYLAANPDDCRREYIAAVKRIWRCRVVAMEAKSGGLRSDLFSGELARWREDIEAALRDPEVSERLASLNSRWDALCKLKVYLEEAWEAMGPSFLESLALMSKGKNGPSGSVADLVRAGGGAEAVCQISAEAERTRDCDGGRVEGSKERGDLNGGGGRDSDGTELGHDDYGACSMEGVVVNGGDHGKERLEERVEVSINGNQEVSGCDLASAQGEKEATQNGSRQIRRKHTAFRTCHRGVKIFDAEEVDTNSENSGSKYDDPLPSADFRKVRESLKSSSLDLKAMVKDPLPDALLASEAARSKLAMTGANHEPPIENQSGYVDVPEANVCQSIVPYQPIDANLGKKSSALYSSVQRPSLTQHNNTARTYEWNDSIDNLPQARLLRRRKRKWTVIEEETLRAGVHKFGEGNWATIRSHFSNIFENRSGVDLKDKWRNMVRQ